MEDFAFRGSTLKVERAKKHIGDLEHVIKVFLQNEPYPISFSRTSDKSGQFDCLSISLIRPLPDEAITVTGDAIGNLRSALDLAACEAARANGAHTIKTTYFPFAADESDFKGQRTQRKMEKLSDSCRRFIATLEPYGGGNELLYALNKLANLDKHQAIIEPAVIPTQWAGTFTMQALGAFPHEFSAPTGIRRLDEDGAALLHFPAGGNLEGEMDLTVDVVFGDVYFLANLPVVATLRLLGQLVEGIIRGISDSVRA